MIELLEPKRLENGQVDKDWWFSLSSNEKRQYKVWHSEVYIKPTPSNKLEVVIAPQILDDSVIADGKGSNEYRPTSWNEYVGQSLAKARVQSYIEGTLQFNESFPHTFLSAPAGHGKTLFASILAHQLKKKIVITTGGELKSEQIFVNKIAECEGGILFIDEANRIGKRVGFFMLPVIEQFQINGKKINPFTVIMATTHKGDLAKDLDALIQRCVEIELDNYNNQELENIIRQYHKKKYAGISIDKEIFHAISINCRHTPRLALRLLKEYIFTKNWEQVLNNNQIIHEGITKSDIRILELLNRSKTGLGKNSLAKYLGVKIQTFENQFEPYLIYRDFIQVDSRRRITDKGKDFLNSLSERLK